MKRTRENFPERAKQLAGTIMTQRANDAYPSLYEIATALGCHRGLILRTITKLQKDLKDRDVKLQAIKTVLEDW